VRVVIAASALGIDCYTAEGQTCHIEHTTLSHSTMDPGLLPNVPSMDISDGSSEEILHLLKTVYWEGLEREICELVLAYQEIEKYQSHPTSDERDDVDVYSSNFKRFCALLSKYAIEKLNSNDGLLR
jgi:hypothetical protein